MPKPFPKEFRDDVVAIAIAVPLGLTELAYRGGARMLWQQLAWNLQGYL